jgi:hypothetical protein
MLAETLLLLAVVRALSCLFLVYSAYVVPMQLSFWMRDNPCDPYETLYTDLVVDTFFLVSDSPSRHALTHRPLIPLSSG